MWRLRTLSTASSDRNLPRQTMTAEAAVLGTPAIRINDFVGRVSYLDELEDYGLAYGFKPGQEQNLLDTLDELLAITDRSQIFLERRQRMLSEKIDPAPWFAKIISMLLQGKPDEEIRRWASRCARPVL